MRRRPALIAAAVAILGAAAAYRAGVGPTAEPPEPPVAAAPRDMAVSALGRIEPQSEIVNLGAGPTDVLADLAVARGSVVKRGQTIGHFRTYREAVAREAAVRRQLAEAEAQRDAEEQLGQARIRAAQAQADGIAAVGPARIEAQAASARAMESELANDEDVLDSRQALFRSDAGSRRGLADQQAVVARARADRDAARARLRELTQQFAFDTANAAAALAVERAATMRARSQVPVASLEQQVALAQAQVENASLVSPIDGTVLNVLVHPGEAVGTGPILVLGDTSVMMAVAEVYETDVPRVRLGARATVTGTALPRPLAGTVVEIGRMIFKNDVLNVDPAARTDARIVQVRIALDDGAAVAGLTNLTVDVVIAAGPATVTAPAMSSAR